MEVIWVGLGAIAIAPGIFMIVRYLARPRWWHDNN